MKSQILAGVLRHSSAVVAAVAMAAVITPAHATNLVVNGGFETSGGAGQVGFNTTVAGWSVPDPNTGSSYTFLYTPGSADTSGADGTGGNVSLWGPGNGSNNGLPGTSPDGGNFIAQDADFQQGAISQTINGLTAGDTYTVGFWWGGAQQFGFSGPTVEAWQVSFGGQTQTTTAWNNPDHGFSGWRYQTFTFTADGSSDVLSFFATGLPAGPPPFALLDGVSVTPTPEPSSIALLLTGFGAIGGLVRSRFKK